MEHLEFGLLAIGAGALAATAGLGGAILLVPLLIVLGVSPSEAAPLGLVMVAAVSVSAAPRQHVNQLVNQRLGVSVEIVASTTAVIGALVSGLLSQRFVALMLAAVATASALTGLARGTALRNPPDPACQPSDIGERAGSLSGAYPLGDQIVPYQPRHIRQALGLMALSGFIAGSAGVSGGFVKTSAQTDVMRVPLKVASATTTFTVGITAAVALIVFATQGRIDARSSAAVLVGSVIGGQIGAAVQHRLSPHMVSYIRSALLIIVAVSLVFR